MTFSSYLFGKIVDQSLFQSAGMQQFLNMLKKSSRRHDFHFVDSVLY